MKPLIISKVKAREIIDSRGNPTIEADVILCDGTVGRGASPSGASTGEDEAYELRDNDKKRFLGKGVLKAVENVNTLIDSALLDKNAADIYGIDEIMKELDGTENKKRLGANAILAVSIAACRAAAKALDMPLYKFLGEGKGCRLPLPMMNILNGGAHADNSLDTQEFMIVPVGAESFTEALRWCTQVYHSLKYTLKCSGFVTSVGDEGGFAPNLNSDEEAIELIIDSIKEAGFKPGEDFLIAIDAAASEWKNGEKGKYKKPKSGREFTTAELIEHWKSLCGKYPIYSLEDPLDEDDWEGWKVITKELGEKVQIVGDDLFVTNTRRLKRGIEEGCANSILIKPNQIGSVSETIDAVLMAEEAGYATIISHRSGETEDTFIADLAVALNAGQIKTGAPSRTERVSKYNQLLRIEEELGSTCVYKKI